MLDLNCSGFPCIADHQVVSISKCLFFFFLLSFQLKMSQNTQIINNLMYYNKFQNFFHKLSYPY